jgi:hypothetical protein
MPILLLLPKAGQRMLLLAMGKTTSVRSQERAGGFVI